MAAKNDFWGNLTGSYNTEQGQKAMNTASGQLGNIAGQQANYGQQIKNAQGVAGQLGQQAATGAGVSAAQSARAAGLNKGQAALVGGQQAGQAYGNTYGQNVQQGVSGQQAALQGAAGTYGQQAGIGQAQMQAGTGQTQALTSGVGQALGGLAQLISDEREKNISTPTNVHSILAKIKPIDYQYKKTTVVEHPGEADSQPRTGVTAQSLEGTELASAVKQGPDGVKRIDNNELVLPLLNYTKQLADELADLRKQLGR